MKFPSFFPRILRPEVFQGRRNPKNYFEGWYCKLVSEDELHIVSVIFGVSYSEDTHCFLQLIDGKTGVSEYLRFPVSAFSYSRKEFKVEIGKNRISSTELFLDITGEKFVIEGNLDFTELSFFPQTLINPGIMGWYSYVPGMECYHGVVSMKHQIHGSLTINAQETLFSGGSGYMEKDWGRSMPSDWIWFQSNHIKGDQDASIMLSIARIPWFGSFFPGFLSFVKVKGKIIRFATYNGSKVKSLESFPDKIKIHVSGPRYGLRLEIIPARSGELIAPLLGYMKREIKESIDALAKIELYDQQGNTLFKGEARNAGLEVVGNVSQYFDTE